MPKNSLNRTSMGIISILPIHMLNMRNASGTWAIVEDTIPVERPTFPCADATSNKVHSYLKSN